MTVSFTLNGKQETIETSPNRRLVDLLHEDFSLSATRAGCYAGSCGTCVVLLDRLLVTSCLVTCLAIQDTEIITVEGLQGGKALKEIEQGFEKTGYRPCPVCYQSKILSLYDLIEKKPMPDESDIARLYSISKCRCTDFQSLLDAVQYINRRRRSRRNADR